MKTGPGDLPSAAAALQVLLSSQGNGSEEQHTHSEVTIPVSPKSNPSKGTACQVGHPGVWHQTDPLIISSSTLIADS